MNQSLLQMFRKSTNLSVRSCENLSYVVSLKEINKVSRELINYFV
jgi:hypothetical protein